jgi:hypothetical protein
LFRRFFGRGGRASFRAPGQPVDFVLTGACVLYAACGI